MVEIWPGALIQQLKKVLDGDVGGSLGPNVLSRSPSGTSHGSSSHLTFQEVLYLTYDIVRREQPKLILQEHNFSSKTVADWGTFCRDNAEYMEGCSEKLWGPNKIGEIDKSMFGRRKTPC